MGTDREYGHSYRWLDEWIDNECHKMTRTLRELRDAAARTGVDAIQYRFSVACEKLYVWTLHRNISMFAIRHLPFDFPRSERHSKFGGQGASVRLRRHSLYVQSM